MRLGIPVQKRIWRSILISAGILAITILFGEGLLYFGLASQNIIMVYTLSVLIVARCTDGYVFGIVTAIAGTLICDFLVTTPRLAFSITIGFPITLLFMLIVSLISCAVTTRMKASFAQQKAIWLEAEKEKTRGTLLRAISHDLRTPLTVILSAGSIIEEQAKTLKTEDICDLASDIRQNSEWLIRMVENLLTVTRISEGSVKLTKTMEVAEEIMGQSVSIVRNRFPECDIKVQSPVLPLQVPVDAILISQVFINLLENAVKYSPKNSTIQFSLSYDDNNAQFEVSDQGRGIPAQIMDCLFEPVSAPGEQNVDSVSGIGIGLSICKAIINAHDGKITGKNKPEGGAVFSVVLPLRRSEKDEHEG